MRRREFIAAMAGAGAGAGQDAAARQPNFLILMADQHNPHVMGCRGDTVVKTPNLDGLAQSGVLFESAYCQSPICIPSRTSFLTGQQPSKNRIWTNDDILPSDVPTFAHALGASGYETALIGQMHFRGIDQFHGFEKRLVGSITPMYPHISHSLSPRLLVGAGGNTRAGIEVAGPGRTAYQAHDKEVTAATVEFLRSASLRSASGSSRPFCAVAGMVLPHPPYVCTEEDWKYYYDKVQLPQTPPGYFESLHPAMQLWRKSRGIDNLSPAEVRAARAAYYGLVSELDRNIGVMLSALRASGLAENTVVVFTADHGDMAGENGMWWKNSFYEGSVSVPLIVSCPARFKPGRRLSQVVSLIDVGPTLIDLAAAERLPAATGTSLVPLLKGENRPWANEAFSEFPATNGVPAMRMIRSGKWKLTHYGGQRPQLFDLENDPREFRDLGASGDHAEIRRRLEERVLSDWPVEGMESEIARRSRQKPLLEKWAGKVKPATPQQWVPPRDANVFPLK